MSGTSTSDVISAPYGIHFITLEDEYGLLDLIVRPDVYERYRGILHHSGVLIMAGVVQRRDAVINVVAEVAALLVK